MKIYLWCLPCENTKNIGKVEKNILILQPQKMVSIAQLVRVADCGSVGRGFESHYSPKFIEN